MPFASPDVEKELEKLRKPLFNNHTALLYYGVFSGHLTVLIIHCEPGGSLERVWSCGSTMNEQGGMNVRTAELELLIDGEVAPAKKTLESHGIAVTIPESTRFLVEAGAVLGIATGVVKLTEALIELSHQLRRTAPAPQVIARSLSGKTILINEAHGNKISSFVEAASGENQGLSDVLYALPSEPE